MDELIGPNVQIVLGVIEGQGFDFTNDPVYVTGSLNGHVLETDFVGPCSSPIFSTNLVWQADKKGLRLMRTSNIPMKVECYSISYENRKERIGYLLLNLRSIQIVPTGKTCTIHQSWNKLMGVKNEGKAFRPELLLSFYVEDDNKNTKEEQCCPSITKLDTTVNLSVSSHGLWRHPTIVPRLCSEEGLIQIGPEETCSDIFLLSILIGTATNLDMLLHENIKNVNNYSFWYSIFGHSVQTKPFYRNLQHPCVLNEKIVLRLRSSLKILNIYFMEVSLINLKLLCDEQEEIGYTNMELKNLIPTEKLTEFLTKYAVNNTVTQNGKCYLYSPVTSETPVDDKGRKPYINVEIKLKYLTPSKTARKSSKSEKPESLPTNSNQVTARSTTELIENDGTQEDVPLRSTSLTGLEPKAVTSCYQEPTPRVTLEAGDYKTDLSNDVFKDIPSNYNEQFISISTGDIPNKETVSNTYTSKSSPMLQLASSMASPKNIQSVEAYHRYSLNVVLESVTFSRIIKQKIIFRFHHPKAEIIYSSHPEISVDSNNEMVYLHDVKCRVNFLSTSQEIARLLLAWPPKISVCENQKDLPVLLGETFLDTSLLFQQNEKCIYIAKLCEPISGNEFAQVKVLMYLEDYGIKFNKEQDSDFVLGPPIVDERLAYKLIEELEDWKEKQQEMFKAELEKKEEARLTLLSSEWNIRRAELETKLSRGVEKCRILAANLSRTTEEQRLRAAKHLEAENRFKMLKEEMEQNYRSKNQDLKEVIRKVEDEYNQKINEIKNENFELIAKLNALERENALLKDTNKTHEQELKEIKKTYLTKEQIASLLQEMKSLEEKLEASIKSKAFFKEEWGKTVREIHRMKSEYQKQLQNQIRINKEELTSFNLKQFLNDEDMQLKTDREALSKIRSDLNFLAKEQMDNHEDFYTTSRPDLLDMNLAEKTAMLIEERDALLRTGSYTEQDPVIMKLNQELEYVKSQSNSLL